MGVVRPRGTPRPQLGAHHPPIWGGNGGLWGRVSRVRWVHQAGYECWVTYRSAAVETSCKKERAESVSEYKQQGRRLNLGAVGVTIYSP